MAEWVLGLGMAGRKDGSVIGEKCKKWIDMEKKLCDSGSGRDGAGRGPGRRNGTVHQKCYTCSRCIYSATFRD